ncbi:uncharacterized protein [Magallana gigas]|uniref:uncharacterized protein isoform X1 n=1 Tax=Magallana gigas TaxID=29159 RepID=UPI00333ECC62
MFNFSTLSAIVIIFFILIFLFLSILRCRMRRTEHKEHDLYNLFFSRSAHRGSILVPNPPTLEVSSGSRKSSTKSQKRLSLRRCSQGDNRRHSLQSLSIETETGPKIPNTARRGRRGSAPVDLLADSINMYKGNELTDRYRLFQSHPSTPQHREGSENSSVPSFQDKNFVSARRVGRRGSAPVGLLSDSINLYRGNELTNRYPYFRCNSFHKDYSKRLNTRISTLSFAAHMNIPEVKESSGNACGTTPDP